MAVASNIEVNDVGMGRSLDEVEEDRREVSEVLDNARERTSRRAGIVRELQPRFGGITTGIVLIDLRVSVLGVRSRPEQSDGINGFIP
jgi:hypothetical protein